MILSYNEQYERYAKYYRNYNNGVFISNRYDTISIINPSLTGHDADPIFKLFLTWFNPEDRFAPYSKQEALKCLKRNIQHFTQLKHLTFDSYLELQLFHYFTLVYSSKYTTIRESTQDVVSLFKTMGYYPGVFYYEDENSNKYPKRLIMHTDLVNILKSILVQSCDIDSLEVAPSQYQQFLSKTILTSKFNPYETFFNYYLMDWDIQVIPKKNYNFDTQMFEEYKLDEFLIPDSELRLKEELISIKRFTKLQDRFQYFR